MYQELICTSCNQPSSFTAPNGREPMHYWCVRCQAITAKVYGPRRFTIDYNKGGIRIGQGDLFEEQT